MTDEHGHARTQVDFNSVVAIETLTFSTSAQKLVSIFGKGNLEKNSSKRIAFSLLFVHLEAR